MLHCRFCSRTSGSICLSRSWKKCRPTDLSRRRFLQYCQGAPLVFLPAGFPSPFLRFISQQTATVPVELQLHPEYRTKRGFEAILSKVPAGSDDFVTEKYQDEVEAIFREWSSELVAGPAGTDALRKAIAPGFVSNSQKPAQERSVRETPFLKVWKVQYAAGATLTAESFLAELRSWLATFSKILTAEFQVVSIRADVATTDGNSRTVSLATIVRFEFVGTGSGFHREQRIGYWELLWERLSSGEMRLRKWTTREEEHCRSSVPVFQDIAAHAFAGNPSYAAQFIPGTDYWRTVLDGACGIDIYGHNGVAVADVDGDGMDDLYICQPSGLPNRLFRNRGDGTFEDITDAAGVGVLENSACALFADVNNSGRQDLIVVRASGPLLFLNQGGGKFRLQPDAFQFANQPQGTFTGAAIADYDRDGWLDIYFCLYSYYQGADQYRYPMPYFDAENGPPNFMMRNHRDGTFRDVTRESHLDQNNTRYSFCCTWGDYNGDNWPDLYVVNDFGRKNLYRNNGDGTFADVAHEAGVEDVGAGMSGAWADLNNDGREDLYIANMWTAAGLRVSEQSIFQKEADGEARALYHQHAMGNSLFRNKGNAFEDFGMRSGTTMGRWAWSSDVWDFDHDGFADIYIANGMVTGTTLDDLNSFFWRQVVANSPNESRPSHEYEQAWNAINDLIRSDRTWSGFERNVHYLNNREGTFSDISGVVGTDFVEDGRTFALGDFDLDGRIEVVLKNRNSPQLRYLKNVLPDLPPAISFRLIGKKSNRDAIGAKVTIETMSGLQARTVRCGSGFLAQHTKEILFGLGSAPAPIHATIQWPSGFTQKLQDLPVNYRIWVEEGLVPTRMEAYRKPANPAAISGAPEAKKVWPQIVETWLLAPVLAPEFSLPAVSGRSEGLASRRGKPVLLQFWSATVAGAQENLREFERVHDGWATKGFEFLVIDVDATESSSSKAQYSFPVLKASPEIIAVYNLLFRQIFDRHRDMSVPISFLVDPSGNIVKIYQGWFSPRKVRRGRPEHSKERRGAFGKSAAVRRVAGDVRVRTQLSFVWLCLLRTRLFPAGSGIVCASAEG